MTKKVTKINTKTNIIENFHKLSIQVSLNGLSFCVIDTISNTALMVESLFFKKTVTPFELQKQLKKFIELHGLNKRTFSEVIVIHRNLLFSLVPRSLFKATELANYLKFNAKILTNDQIVYDEVKSYDMVNVYVPFTNINNFIFEVFGEFEFQHHSTIIIHSLLSLTTVEKDTIAYVHVSQQEMDVTIISNRHLLLFNSFDFNTKEDFLYYLLFVFEQLKLDSHQVALKLFGTIEEGDEIYKCCYEYFRHINIFIPPGHIKTNDDPNQQSIDFTLLNTF